MPALIECPYCGEYTELKGGVCIENTDYSGRDICQECKKIFYYEFGFVNVKTTKTEERE